MQACAAAGEDEVVNQDDFRYGGPSPRSKETGIMLLADTCEAAVRSIRPSTRDELEALVHRLVDQHIEEGELNDSNLTFREVQQVKEVFVRVLEGVHHPRISYPDAESISSGPLREAEKSSMRNGSSAEAADDFVPGSMDEFETETGTEVSSETGR